VNPLPPTKRSGSASASPVIPARFKAHSHRARLRLSTSVYVRRRASCDGRRRARCEWAFTPVWLRAARTCVYDESGSDLWKVIIGFQDSMMYNGGTWVALLQKKKRADCHQRSI